MSSSTTAQVYNFGDVAAVYIIFYMPPAASIHHPPITSVGDGPSTNVSGTNHTPSIIVLEVRECFNHMHGAIPSSAFILPHSTALTSGISTHSQPSQEFLHIRNQPRFSLLAIAFTSAVVGALAMFMALAFT
ncbi:hypothetical protein F5878DRAFT_645285 [Lentinula raphanica]|uniref:Uncharacterized protein n=1 Tax=Lentinula raphanica TaxID=153919 RepID=A0AA38UDK2_9AGAR|nr:hypothetical protein EV360DRAFT_73271 [Lentinula raphanica]KAJ3834257.1 hypothetical protein F5878DRAFT_645285 [Lentinula raphanica]